MRRRKPPSEAGNVRGEALPFHSASKDRNRFHCAEANGPWLNIRGRNRHDLGYRQLSTA
jgi:hypothetical protein